MFKAPPNWYNNQHCPGYDKPEGRYRDPLSERIRALIRAHPDMTMPEIAEKLDTSYRYVWMIADRAGLKPKRIKSHRHST